MANHLKAAGSSGGNHTNALLSELGIQQPRIDSDGNQQPSKSKKNPAKPLHTPGKHSLSMTPLSHHTLITAHSYNEHMASAARGAGAKLLHMPADGTLNVLG